MAEPKTLRFLDGARGLAALYVLLFHARWLMWEGFTEGYSAHPALYSLPAKLVAYALLLFYYGHQAVIFFFVLSGFVIHLRYARQFQADIISARFDLIPYLRRRIRRLYPPLLLSLLITFTTDSVGRQLYAPMYNGTTHYVLINNVGSLFDLQRLAGGLTMVPNAPEWGSNIPLWSLRLEWFFYLLYPLFWWIGKRSMWLATAILVTLCGLSLFMGSGGLLTVAQNVFALMLVWWFGVLLAEIYVGRIKIGFSRLAPLGLGLLVLPLTVEPFMTMQSTLRDLLWGVGFSGLLAALFAWRNRGGSLRLLEQLKPLGDMSFTLYVIHFPILFLVSAWLMSRSPDGTLPRSYEWIGAGALLCLAVAYFGHQLVERPFKREPGRNTERYLPERGLHAEPLSGYGRQEKSR
jgi:peptidoglycan/LPS O-acetylase OafA/YrhL